MLADDFRFPQLLRRIASFVWLYEVLVASIVLWHTFRFVWGVALSGYPSRSQVLSFFHRCCKWAAGAFVFAVRDLGRMHFALSRIPICLGRNLVRLSYIWSKYSLHLVYT